MQKWHPTPVSKVYEALGAIADNRVTHIDKNTAKVISSTGDKSYTVEWGDAFEWIISNDNASYWQGYIGYPIVAVLLNEKKITYNSEIAEALKGVPWKQLNSKHKNKYDKTIQEVLEKAKERGIVPELIVKECERIAEEVNRLNLSRPDGKRKPPPMS